MKDDDLFHQKKFVSKLSMYEVTFYKTQITY